MKACLALAIFALVQVSAKAADLLEDQDYLWAFEQV